MKEIARLYQQARREKLLGQMMDVMDHVCDWLESGKSFEETEIMIDILAAGGQASGKVRQWSHKALSIICSAREQKADRN